MLNDVPAVKYIEFLKLIDIHYSNYPFRSNTSKRVEIKGTTGNNG